MTNITDQPCFKRAVEIAGWPGELYCEGRRWLLSARPANVWQPITEWQASALLEKHFREWLAERRWNVHKLRSGAWRTFDAAYIPRRALDSVDYLKGLCLAVAECE